MIAVKGDDCRMIIKMRIAFSKSQLAILMTREPCLLGATSCC
jgi:hypothetical protein